MKPIVSLAAAALVCACRLSADTTAPTLVSASVTPHAVDITSATRMVTATFHVTDAESGFHYGNAYLYDEGGKFVYLAFFGEGERTGGNSADGTYSIMMPVPRYSAPGTWRLEAFIRDQAGNQASFNPHDLPFPVPADVALTVQNDGVVDISAPTLDSISATPGEVDVTNVEQVVEFTLVISDAPAGFDFGFVTVARDGFPDISKAVGQEHLVSGDANSGEYHVSVTIPRGTAAGEWHYKVSLKDKAGNSYDSVSDGTLTIVNTPPPAASNFLALAVDAVQFPWSTSGGGWVIESADTYDDVDAAGSLPIPDNGTATIQTIVTGPGDLSFLWRASSEQDADFLKVSVDGGAPVQSLSGETAWTKVIMSLPPGEHTVAWTYDKNGSVAQGADRGFLDQVRFHRDSDGELPVLQSLEISPRLTDLTSGSQLVTFTIDITDDFNGLQKGRLELYDPAGGQQVSTEFDYAPDAGDLLGGKWVVTLEVPNDAGFGLWRAEIELTEAATGLTRRYGPGNEPFPGGRTEYFYAGDPEADDAEPPFVQEISVTPGAVDITAGMAKAIVTLRITDPNRGFNYGEVPVYNPDENWTGAYFFDSSNLVSGDSHNGIYQVEISVPIYGQAGTWTVGASIEDTSANRQEYPFDLDFPAGANQSFTVANSGAADVVKPAVTAISISPSDIGTTGGPADIQLTVTIVDGLSGILQAFAYFYDPADGFQGYLFDNLLEHRISGDDSSGVYQITKTLAQGSSAGRWRVRVFLRDKAGNAVFYGENAEPYPNPGDGSFNVVGSVFANYVGSFGLVGASALPAADPDNDGVPNALEALLGSSPTNAASAGAGLISTSRDATNFYLNFTIAPGLTATTAGDFLALGNGTGGAPLRVTGQTQNGLAGAWTDTLPEHVGGASYRVAIPFASGAKGFARLHFEDP